MLRQPTMVKLDWQLMHAIIRNREHAYVCNLLQYFRADYPEIMTSVCKSCTFSDVWTLTLTINLQLGLNLYSMTTEKENKIQKTEKDSRSKYMWHN